ncbi:MAG: DNA polymerase III subunit beta, partial [Spirochaetia bacterium]|nr:DNA polymerase III subunit beta [Spirochaetia bacterium]
RRLALIQSPLASKEDEYSLIIPQQVLSQLQKIIQTEGPLEIASAENRIHFRLDNFSISSNVLSGKFPNYNMFIPSSHQNQFAINTAEITGAISLASVLADAESNKMVWDLSGNSLKISAQNADYGESQEEIFVSYKGEEVRIGINYKLLGEILKEIETDETEFHFNNALSPILVREKNRKEYFYIIMPMRLEDKA